MRKLAYLAFLGMVAFGLHCYSDYPLLVDEYSGEIVNTSGKAHIRSQQWAEIFPDGADNLFSMVDQKANGDQTLTTYNFYTTDGTYFYDDVYCSPEWSGCAIFTAPNPRFGDDDIYDGRLNENCSGARSFLFIIAATDRYYGECGRAPLSIRDRMRILDSGTLLDDFTLAFDLNASNTSVFLDDNAGHKSLVPLLGNARVETNVRGAARSKVYLDNPMLAHTFRAAADWADRYNTGQTTITLSFNGVERELQVRLFPDAIRRTAERF